MDPMEILQDFPVPSQEVLLGLFLGHGLEIKDKTKYHKIIFRF